MEILFSIVVFLFVIGIMVLVHEYGHFIAAKKIGVTVEAFSIGFGPKIVGWTRGGTEYKWCLLPLGGYVKMLGEEPGEDTESAGDDPGAYNNRKRWERFIILIMGPLFNVILAYLIWVVLLTAGEPKPAYLLEEPVIGHVTSESPADKAGFQKGDLVKSIQGKQMDNWQDVIFTVSTSPREKLNFSVVRDGKPMTITVDPDEDAKRGAGTIGIAPSFRPEIGAVDDGSPADKAGLAIGDVITRIGNTDIASFQDMQDRLSKYEGEAGAIAVTVLRDGAEKTMQLTPQLNEDIDRYVIGVARIPDDSIIVRHGFFESIGLAFDRCVEMSVKLFEVLGKLFTGLISPKAISGPIEIAAISGAAAQDGLFTLMNLMAFISLNLGIVNLLPLPVLDGGQILILGVEGTMRRDLSMPVKEWIMRVGVVLLLALMAFVIFQDIMKVLGV